MEFYILLGIIVAGLLALNGGIWFYLRYIKPDAPEPVPTIEWSTYQTPNPTVQQEYIEHAVQCEDCGLLGEPCPVGTKILQRVESEYGIMISGGDNRARP